MGDYVGLTDVELHRLTRRRLQERPTDAQARQELIDELRAPTTRSMRCCRAAQS
jgi:hypothetical protein